MTRRVPIVPTIIVLLAALLMVRLGVWQIHRLHEKEALLARYSANQGKPPLPLAALFPVDDSALYRRTSAFCLNVAVWRTGAGRAPRGRSHTLPLGRRDRVRPQSAISRLTDKSTLANLENIW